MIFKSHIKQRINNLLSELSKRYYFEIPIDQIEQILSKFDVILLNEDRTIFSGIFCGNDSNCLLDIGNVNVITNGFYEVYTNSVLKLTWYKLESGKYEITCYLT